MIKGYLAYRCPHCKSDRCGNDANSGWDVVTQSSVLLGEFDNQWCNDCGDVTLEEYEVTDPAEIAEIDAERARLRVRDAADDLLAAARQAEAALRHALTACERDALISLRSAIAHAGG
jgi:hypothetical protein